MRCVICGGFMSHLTEDLYQCNACALVSSNVPADLSLYDRSYCEKYRRYETKMPNRNRRLQEIRYNLVRRHAPPRFVSLLDFGCGHGAFLHFCNGNGIQAQGFDINPHGGFADVSALFGFYDVVTFWDVLEHLPDPVRIINGLKPSVLVFCTPNTSDAPEDLTSWKHYYSGEHVHYFNEQSARILLDVCGYELREMNYNEGEIRLGGGDRNILSVAAQRK